MRNHRLVVSAAVIAASVGLIPGAAQAAGPVKPDAHGTKAPDLNLGQGRGDTSSSNKFTSPADRTVRKALPSAEGKTATAQTPGVAADNPNLAVQLTGYGASAHGIEIDSVITSADASLSVTVEWGDGKSDQFDTFGNDKRTLAHTYAEVGAYTVKYTVTDAANNVTAVNDLAVVTPGSDFTAHTPTRLLDTRDGTGAAQGKVAGRGTTRVKIAGNANIPAGVTAVALNVTVTNTVGGGHVTAYAEGSERPTTSNVNFSAGQTVPNLVIVPVGKNGYVELFNGGWESVDLIADVTGYFSRTASSGYTPIEPSRFVDTREGLGTARGQLGGRKSFTTQIGGLRGVPSGITAVALNVTVTNPKQAGYLSAYPGGGAVPSSSNLNFTAGQTIANSVIVPVSADGRISVFNGAWSAADVIVDVVGYYSPGSESAYMRVIPERLLDTRDSSQWSYGPLEGQGYIYMPLSTKAPSITGVVLNSTVTNTKGTGYLTVSPDPNSIESYNNGTAGWPDAPNSSNLNWTKGATVPNLVQTSMGYNGIIDFWNKGWEDTDLVVDIFGYYEKG
ncbi:hypothetical protein ACFCV9_29585 [Streptomyces sp. NPDC056367]|uniref:hypothetical protein n=1 Tax=Streptomyces sp. NPDC056367 TaxID=3345797 RepID=UPI0035E33A19